MTVTAAPVRGSAGAGSYTEAITVTNTGSTACNVGGHPGVQRAVVSAADVRTVGAPAAWTAQRYVPLYLAPGQSAVAELRVTRAENYDPARCGGLVSTNALNVYVPGSTVVTRTHSVARACRSADLVTATVGVFRR